MAPNHDFQKVFLSELKRLGAESDRAVFFAERIDSTSTDLRRRLEAGSPPGTVVAAHRQDAGRGRQGNTWHSPADGNLYISLAVAVENAPGRLGLLPLAAGVAAWEAVEQLAPVNARLKWPNDLLVAGRKLAGILCEAIRPEPGVPFVIVGLGLNIQTARFPADLAQIGISLRALTPLQPPPATLAAKWVTELEQWLERVDRGETAELIEAWRTRAEPFGRRVRVGRIEGTTIDLDRNGRLIVRQVNGEEVTVSGGVIESLKP